MRNTLFALAVGIAMAGAGPAHAQDIAAAGDGGRADAEPARIPWESRWTGDAAAPAEADAPDDTPIAAETGGGPPISIVPATYSGGYGRPADVR